GRAVRPGEVVIDLFGGIGYLALPALVLGGASRAFIVEKNPVAFAYLVENLALNRVSDRAVPILGDNREVVLPIGAADRVLLGYLPTSRSWLERGLGLLRPSGGVVHVHEVVGASEGPDRIESEVRSRAEGLGWTVRSATARAVKPYGPGRTHAVVDLSVGPQAPA
ncbi:MAG TPA: class I SAM-dependent methyltransferase family protein, partial [Thermoplasmata archaeon]|nr:class I SAM-dependent methyltransferase family protein [Thermoplasmata archaeon]